MVLTNYLSALRASDLVRESECPTALLAIWLQFVFGGYCGSPIKCVESRTLTPSSTASRASEREAARGVRTVSRSPTAQAGLEPVLEQQDELAVAVLDRAALAVPERQHRPEGRRTARSPAG